jgi:Xaa-Pro aminopeptidase
MRYTQINSNLFKKNRKKLSQKLKPGSVAILVSNDQFPKNGDQFYPFRQSSDLFYLSGIEQEKTIIVIFPDAPYEKYKEMAFVIKPNKLLETWEGKKLSREDATKISGIENIYFEEQFESIIAEVMVYAENVYLNRNEYPKFQTDILNREIRFSNWVMEKFPNHKFERLAPILWSLRIKKEKEEIELISKAVDITEKAFHHILKKVKPGIHEFEIEAELDFIFKKNRANGHAYDPIVASGKNALSLHYTTNNDVCKSDDLILFDFGADYSNYAADLSRTIPVNGRFTKRQKEVYNAVHRTLKESMKLFKPGSTIDIINEQTGILIEKELIDLGLLTLEEIKKQDKSNPAYRKYFMHGTSHFMGLDVHDVGHKFTAFEKGMVMSCEPGIYIPEEGIGIRLENDMLITENGSINLMKDFPIEIEEIEEEMNR